MIPVHRLQAGDVLLFKNKTSMISWAIRLIEGNKYIHSAVVLVAGNDPFVAEIDTDFDLRVVPASVVLTRGNPDVFRMKTDKVFNIVKGFDYAHKRMGSRYNYLKIVDACINHAIGVFKRDHVYRSWLSNDDKHVCSTLVSAVLSEGYGIPYNQHSEPDDYCKDPFYLVG